MKTIQVFDPALCCSTGVCGTDVPQQLVTFAADVDWAKGSGARIERFNLAQQPLAFAKDRRFKCDTKSLVEVVPTVKEGTTRVTG